jgi:hypothetical protein
MPANNKLLLKRFAKGSILLQSAHVSTPSPSGRRLVSTSACQLFALGVAEVGGLFLDLLRDQSFREGL